MSVSIYLQICMRNKPVDCRQSYIKISILFQLLLQFRHILTLLNSQILETLLTIIFLIQNKNKTMHSTQQQKTNNLSCQQRSSDAFYDVQYPHDNKPRQLPCHKDISISLHLHPETMGKLNFIEVYRQLPNSLREIFSST